jgi:hypothetical protein
MELPTDLPDDKQAAEASHTCIITHPHAIGTNAVTTQLVWRMARPHLSTP